MIIRWWRTNAAFLGTAAQWAGALASLGTLLVAMYGFSKAIPYFENLNLRELNAQLQLSNRKLADDHAQLRTQVDTAEIALSNQERKTSYALGLFLCARMSASIFDVIRAAEDKTFRHLMLAGVSPEGDPPHLLGPRVKIRDVFDVPIDVTTGYWWRTDEEKALTFWKEFRRRNEERSDLVIFPGSDGKVRPSVASLERAQENIKVAWSIRDEVRENCSSLLPNLKE